MPTNPHPAATSRTSVARTPANGPATPRRWPAITPAAANGSLGTRDVTQQSLAQANAAPERAAHSSLTRDVIVRSLAVPIAAVPIAAVLVAAALVLVAASAAALEPVYRDEVRGGVSVTGNTLGLSGSAAGNTPGTRDSVGTFLSRYPQDRDASPAPPRGHDGWPLGTTAAWERSGSSAWLDLPEGAEVLYAILLWGGSYKVADEDVAASLDVPIPVRGPDGALSAVTADRVRVTLAEPSADGRFKACYHVRGADLTALVQRSGAGEWLVGGVPATRTPRTGMMNAAGWTLATAWTHPDAPMRSVALFAGARWVDEGRTGTSAVRITLPGTCTPPSGHARAAIAIAAMEGDANLGGDRLGISGRGPGQPERAPEWLSGPNNPERNVLASQLNDSTGRLDTRGTAGHCNHDPLTQQNREGCRQGWDVTTLWADSRAGALGNGWTETTLTALTDLDSYVLHAVGLAVDLNSADLVAPVMSQQLTASGGVHARGGDATLYLELHNTGTARAEQITLQLQRGPAIGLSTADLCVTPFEPRGPERCVDVTEDELRTGVSLPAELEPGQRLAIELPLRRIAPDDPPGEPPTIGSSTGEAWVQPSWQWSYLPCADRPWQRAERDGSRLTLDDGGAEPPRDDGPPEDPTERPAPADELWLGHAIRRDGCQLDDRTRLHSLLVGIVVTIVWQLLRGPRDWTRRR